MKKSKFWKILLTVLTLGVIASKSKIIRGSVGGALENVDTDALKNISKEE